MINIKLRLDVIVDETHFSSVYETNWEIETDIRSSQDDPMIPAP